MTVYVWLVNIFFSEMEKLLWQLQKITQLVFFHYINQTVEEMYNLVFIKSVQLKDLVLLMLKNFNFMIWYWWSLHTCSVYILFMFVTWFIWTFNLEWASRSHFNFSTCLIKHCLQININRWGDFIYQYCIKVSVVKIRWNLNWWKIFI